MVNSAAVIDGRVFEPINKDRIIYRSDNSLWNEKNRSGMRIGVKPITGMYLKMAPPLGLRCCINSVIPDFEKEQD